MSKRFTEAGIKTTKAAVRQELANLPMAHRLTHILDQLVTLSDNVESVSAQMRSLILLMSALVHHERHSGLRSNQIKNIQRKVIAILRVNRVKPENGKLSYLYNELDLILSQIDRKEGRHLSSVWRQSLVLRSAAVGDAAFNGLASGIRQLRRGNLEAAEAAFSLAQSHYQGCERWEQALIGRLKCARLGCNFTKAAALIEPVDVPAMSPRGHLELQWEQSLMKLLHQGDARQILRLTRKRTPHYNGEYLLEYKLWAWLFPNSVPMGRVPLVKTLYEQKKINLHVWRDLYQVVQGIEEFLDSDIPLRLRLRNLGDLIEHIENFIAIEHVALAWAALAKVLSKKRQFEIAHLALNEYRALCLRLTMGASDDVFQIGCHELAGRTALQEVV